MKLPAAIREMFRQQGKVGGKKRLKALPAERRREIAKQAAEARWRKHQQKRKRGER